MVIQAGPLRLQKLILSPLLLAPLLMVGFGCGTIINLGGGNLFEAGPEVYGGLRQDIATLRRGGAHEPFSPLLSCMDVPFSLALDTIVLPVTIPIDLLRDSSPESELLRIRDRIIDADTLSVEFSTERTLVRPLEANVKLLLKKGGKIRLEVVYREGDRKRTLTYISDGKHDRGSIDEAPLPAYPTPVYLESAIRMVLFTDGFLDATWFPPSGGWEELLHQKNFGLTLPATESVPKVDHVESWKEKYSWSRVTQHYKSGFENALIFDLAIASPSRAYQTTLFYNPSTLGIRYKTLQSQDGSCLISENYARFQFDEPILDEHFLVPP